MKVLILSMSVGAGHTRAAEAIAKALHQESSSTSVVHIDVYPLLAAPGRFAFGPVYRTVISHASPMWREIYARTASREQRGWFSSASSAAMSSCVRSIKRAILKEQPDAVICTHFTAAQTAASLRRRGKCGHVSVCITDFDFHAAWLHAGVDLYCVPTEDIKHAVSETLPGVEAVATGIPTFPEFNRNSLDRRALRDKFELSEDRTTVLVSGGGFGLQSVSALTAALAGKFRTTQFVAVAGRNPTAFEELQALEFRTDRRVRAFGFVNNMHELMAVSDVAVGKCGGLTSSECLAMGLPMLIVNPIPGQEERNCDYLLETGAALRAHSMPMLLSRLHRVLSDASLRARMSRAAIDSAHPHAANEIARLVTGARRTASV